MNTPIVSIANTAIRQDAEGRWFLNDLHKASGGEEKKTPNRWTRTDSYQSLVNELTPELAFAPAVSARGGKEPGTYVCKELVYAYAMWISPAFHLKVIRTFDALVTGQAQPASPWLDYAALQHKYIALLEQENDRLKNPLAQASTQASFGAIKAWTPEEDALVQTLKAQGLGPTRIGLQLGRTSNSVRCRLQYVAKRKGDSEVDNG